ncbi:helix-turn-helix domain-containing protein [Nostoc sp. UIC 10890]
MNYRYRIYPNITQEQSLIEWMDVCRHAFNYGLLLNVLSVGQKLERI